MDLLAESQRSTSQSSGSLKLFNYCLQNLAGKTMENGRVVVIRCNKETNYVGYGLAILQYIFFIFFYCIGQIRLYICMIFI